VADRWTVYFKRNGFPEDFREVTAPDRERATEEVTKSLGMKDWLVTRIVPGWPERKKKPA